MQSILKEIQALRQGKPLVVDRNNSNRYRLLCKEEDGSTTAYCFSIPVYEQDTGKMVELRFREQDGTLFMIGSNARVMLGETILLKNEEGSCELLYSKATRKEAVFLPTINGIAVQISCPKGRKHAVKIRVEKPFMEVRTNDRCFSLMQEEFRPLATVSCIGVVDGNGTVIAPCALEFKQEDDRTFALTVKHQQKEGRQVLYEVNLHEPKLFQDTTVESLHPEVNNAFGGTAFLGRTPEYGEQWLYARPDLSKLPELANRRIYKAILHLPQYKGGNHDGTVMLAAFRVAARFCSFGSTWNSRITMGEALADVVTPQRIPGYQSLNIIDLITDRNTHSLTGSEGLILKQKETESGFTAIATGDSFYSPQILEINFR